MHQPPGEQAERDEQPPRPHATLDEQREHGERGERQQQGADREVVGVEDGDDGDRDEVVDHGQREQEHPQGRRQEPADDRQHGHGERDVGRGGDRPPAQCRRITQVDHDVDRRGKDHAADRRRDRHRRPPWVPEFPGDELAFELQPHHEEEDGQQTVGGPVRQVEIQVQRLRADGELPHRRVGLRPGRVRPDQRDDRPGQQQHPAHGLQAQDLGDLFPLPPGRAAEQLRCGGGWCAHLGLVNPSRSGVRRALQA